MKKTHITFSILFIVIAIAITVLFSLYRIVNQPAHLIWPQDKERGPDSLIPLVMINTAAPPDSDQRYVRILWKNYRKQLSPKSEIPFNDLSPISEALEFSYEPDIEPGLVYQVVSTNMGESDFHIVVHAYEWEVLKHIYTFDTIEGKIVPVQVEYFDHGRGKLILQRRTKNPQTDQSP